MWPTTSSGYGRVRAALPADRTIDAQVSDRTLHEIYLEPFRRALVRYGIAGLLGSYNRLNGRYVCQDPELLNLPRTQWGWAGFTVPESFSIRNVGSRPGKAVPQLYVAFPSAADEPPAQLKAFQAVRLEPGQASELGMEIPVDDLAIFGDGSRSRVVPGMYEIQLGASSADLRLKAAVKVP
jgi:Fibronectin type III-like domain